MTRIAFAFVLLLLTHPAQAQLRGHGGPVRALAISADGQTAVSGSFDSSVIRWSLPRNAADQVLRFHQSAVNAVAAAIAQARADWGVAIEPVAKMYGLGFLPLSPEHYDFLLIESRRDRPAVQAFLAALRDRRTKDRIAALGMQPADD